MNNMCGCSLQFSAMFYLNCMAECSVFSSYVISLLCCVFRALIRGIEFIKRKRNALQFYELMSLYRDLRHVWDTHVAIFMVVSAKIQIYL